MKKIVALTLGLMLSFSAFSAPDNITPAGVLGAKLAALQMFLRQPKNRDNKIISQYVDDEIAPMFDTAYMAKWIAGPVGRNMNESQKYALELNVRRKLFNLVLKQLSGYSGQKVLVKGGHFIDARQAVVNVAVVQTTGQGRSRITPVDFRLYRSDIGWRVFDIVASRVSILNNFRQQFMANSRRRR